MASSLLVLQITVLPLSLSLSPTLERNKELAPFLNGYSIMHGKFWAPESVLDPHTIHT